MLVVSDTTPLNYLVLIQAEVVLPPLYTVILIPSQVIEELQRPKAPEPARQWASSLPSWAKVQEGDATHFPSLNYGEASAIALAIDVHANALLADDLDARLFAESLGLVTVGTVGILAAAHNASLLDFDSAIRALRNTNFHVQDGIIVAARKALLRSGSGDAG